MHSHWGWLWFRVTCYPWQYCMHPGSFVAECGLLSRRIWSTVVSWPSINRGNRESKLTLANRCGLTELSTHLPWILSVSLSFFALDFNLNVLSHKHCDCIKVSTLLEPSIRVVRNGALDGFRAPTPASTLPTDVHINN